MKIAIEISPLLAPSGNEGEKSGLYRILYNMILGLSIYCEKTHKKNTIFLFTQYPHLLDKQPSEFKFLLNRPNIALILIPPYSLHGPLLYFREYIRFISRHFFAPYSQNNYMKRLKKELNRKKVDIIHHSETCYFNAQGFINVITINDLIPIKFPTLCQNKTIRNMKRKLFFAKNHCQGVVCISNRSKKDLLEYWRYSGKEKQIEVIHPSFFPLTSSTLSFPKLKSGIPILQSIKPYHYFFSYGTYEPRKNFMMLVRLFHKLKKENKLGAYKLVLAGGRGWGNVYEDIQIFIHNNYKEIEQSPVIQIEYIKDEMLSLLIKNSRAVLYPSIYEGYGYPITEASYYRIPIYVSQAKCFTESDYRNQTMITFVRSSEWKTVISTLIKTGNSPYTERGNSVKKLILDTSPSLFSYYERLNNNRGIATK